MERAEVLSQLTEANNAATAGRNALEAFHSQNKEAMEAIYGVRPEPNVYFFFHPVLDAERTKQLGRPVFTDKVYVMIHVPDGKDYSSRLATREEINMYPKAFAVFQHAVQHRTASLKVLPRMTASVLRMLSELKVNNVQQLADAKALPADLAAYQHVAKLWLALQEDAYRMEIPEPCAMPDSSKVIPAEAVEIDDKEIEVILSGKVLQHAPKAREQAH